MNYRFQIEVTVKEFHSPFKPNITRYEFEVTAEKQADAFKIASGKVKTRGYPYDSTSVRELWSKPIFDEAAEMSQLQAISAKTDHLKSTEEYKAGIAA